MPAFDVARLGARLGVLLGALVGALDGALDLEGREKNPVGASDGGALERRSLCRSEGAWVGARDDRERRERRDEATEPSSSNLKRGSRRARAVVTSMPDMAAAVGVMNSPSTEVPTLSACTSATPRLHISTELSASVLSSIISSISISG